MFSTVLKRRKPERIHMIEQGESVQEKVMIESKDRELERLRDQIKYLTKKLDAIMESMPCGLIVHDAETGKFQTISEGCLEIFGCGDEAFREHFYNNFNLMIYKMDRKKVQESIDYQLQYQKHVEVTFRSIGLLGETRFVEYRGNQMDEPDGRLLFYGTLTDVSDRVKIQQEMQRKSELDPMTGLFNKTAMEEILKEVLQDSSEDEMHALFIIDADKFKQINDSLGHMIGDGVIKYVASQIKKNFREADYVGRIGGDEFMVLMKNTTMNAIRWKAAAVNAAVREEFEEEGISIQITCSIGIACYREHGKNYEALFEHADKALYEIKNQGRDGYCIYGENE